MPCNSDYMITWLIGATPEAARDDARKRVGGDYEAAAAWPMCQAGQSASFNVAVMSCTDTLAGQAGEACGQRGGVSMDMAVSGLELCERVPVHDNLFVMVDDIPEPYRSEFKRDQDWVDRFYLDFDLRLRVGAYAWRMWVKKRFK